MSEPIEKVSGLSVLVSGVGTWTGLGVGLGVLMTAVMAVTGVLAALTPPNRSISTLEQRISADILSSVPGSIKIGAEGSELSLTIISEDKKKVVVKYRKSKQNLLERQEQGLLPSSLGRCRELKFRLQDRLLLATVSDEHGRAVQSWATNRWGKAR